jgi:hypothetical protein
MKMRYGVEQSFIPFIQIQQTILRSEPSVMLQATKEITMRKYSSDLARLVVAMQKRGKRVPLEEEREEILKASHTLGISVSEQYFEIYMKLVASGGLL